MILYCIIIIVFVNRIAVKMKKILNEFQRFATSLYIDDDSKQTLNMYIDIIRTNYGELEEELG